jgi:phage-related protein
MAGSYGQLTIAVTADTKGLRVQITREAEAAGQEAARSIGQSMAAGLKAVGGLAGSIGKSVATGLGVASAAAIGFGVSAFQSAARVGEMDASLRALAKANNLSYDTMQKTVQAVRKQGIEYGVSQQLVAQFARNQLDLADATKLAAVAQDAAVISGRNSTEVLSDLVHGITTQNSLVLRNAGLNVQAGKAMDDYARSVGKSTKDLTESERAQAVLNATLESGKTVAGAYAEAMTEPGKVLRSFKRVVDDIKVSVGQGLVKALKPAIIGAYDLAKSFSAAVAPGGALTPIFDAIGVAVAKLVAPVTAIISQWAKLIEGLKPDQLRGVISVLERFGPAILVAAGALATFTGAGLLAKVPILGGLLTNLLGPVKLVGTGLLALGKAAAGSLAGMLGLGSGAAAAGGGFTAVLGPIALVVAALAALAAASPKFRAGLVDVAKGLVSMLKPAIDAVIAGVRQLLPPILDVVRALGDALAPILSRLAPLLGPIGQIIGNVLTVAFQLLGGALRIVAPLLVILLQLIGFLLDKLLAVVVPVVKFVLSMTQLATAALTVLNPLGRLADVFTKLIAPIQAVVRWILGGSPGLIPALQALAAVIGSVSGVIMGIVGVFAAMASGVAAAWSAVTSATSAAWSAITGAVRSGTSAVSSVVSSAFRTVQSVVSSSIKTTASTVSSGMSSMASAARSAGSSMTSALSSAGSSMVSAMRSAMAQISGAVSSGLASAVSAARSGGAAIMSGLQSGINSAAGAVMSTISSVASKISGALSSALKVSSPSKLTIPMGVDVIRGIEVGMAREARHLDVPDLALPAVSGGGLFGAPQLAGAGGGGAITINVYPQASQDPREVAAMVSRELAWAQAGGL